MNRVALLACLFLAGCTSLPERGDFYETQFRGVQALGGSADAFGRVQSLQRDWQRRAEPGPLCRLTTTRAHRERASVLAEGSLRVVRARESVLSLRDTTAVIVNALADLEAEHDALTSLLMDSEASVALVALVAEQKYLARRMSNSLVLMSQADMSSAVEAADLFGRDVARYQSLLDAAINGSEEMGIDPPDSPEVEDSLAQIEELFSGYVADSTAELLDSVAYRYDAWLALTEMAALDDGRQSARRDKAANAATGDTAEKTGEPSAEDAESGVGETDDNDVTGMDGGDDPGEFAEGDVVGDEAGLMVDEGQDIAADDDMGMGDDEAQDE